MSINKTASIFNIGTLLQVNVQDIPGVKSIQGLGGTSSTYNTTSLSDDAIVEQTGLYDGGSLSITGEALPHNPVMEVLEDANINSKNVSLRLIIGGRPAGAGYTDGSARSVIEDRTMTVALEQSKAVFTDAENSTLPGVTVNDYLEYLTGNAPGTAQTTKITSATVTSNTAKFGTNLSTAPTLTSNSKVKILRPAVKYSMGASVPQFQMDFPENDSIKYSVTFRIAGKPVREVGTPTITI